MQTDHVIVVASRFNEAITRKLVDGANESLRRLGYTAEQIHTTWVPGAFEIPLTVQVALKSGRYAFAVAIGAVIRGETPHFDYVCSEVTRGLGDVMRTTGIPVGFGVLTCDDVGQARARAGGDAGNKGAEAAEAAFDTWKALRAFETRS